MAVTPGQARKFAELVSCPLCQTHIGLPCLTSVGDQAAWPHTARLKLAAGRSSEVEASLSYAHRYRKKLADDE